MCSSWGGQPTITVEMIAVETIVLDTITVEGDHLMC